MDNAQPGQNPTVSYDQPAPQPPGRSFHVSKKLLVIVGILLFLSLLGTLLFIRSRSTTSEQAMQPKNILLVRVGEKEIYTNDVKKAARDQYASSAINDDIIKKFYDIVIEREILENEASRLGIAVTEQEITDIIGSEAAKSPSLHTSTRFGIIKNKIIQSQTLSVTAFTIGYWIPPYSRPQVPLFTEQRTTGKNALQEGKVLLEKGQSPLTVAKTLYNQYPTLQKILTINGKFVEKLTDKTTVETPETYTKGEVDFEQQLFSLSKSQIVIVDGKDGAGANLIQVVDSNKGEYTDYELWLENKKNELVKIVNTL